MRKHQRRQKRHGESGVQFLVNGRPFNGTGSGFNTGSARPTDRT